jgi:hypothetical protein
MNLDGLTTGTTVSFQHSLPFDELVINGREVMGAGVCSRQFVCSAGFLSLRGYR